MKNLINLLKITYKEGNVRDHNRCIFWLQKNYNLSRDDIDFIIAG